MRGANAGCRMHASNQACSVGTPHACHRFIAIADRYASNRVSFVQNRTEGQSCMCARVCVSMRVFQGTVSNHPNIIFYRPPIVVYIIRCVPIGI